MSRPTVLYLSAQQYCYSFGEEKMSKFDRGTSKSLPHLQAAPRLWVPTKRSRSQLRTRALQLTHSKSHATISLPDLRYRHRTHGHTSTPNHRWNTSSHERLHGGLVSSIAFPPLKDAHSTHYRGRSLSKKSLRHRETTSLRKSVSLPMIRSLRVSSLARRCKSSLLNGDCRKRTILVRSFFFFPSNSSDFI